MKKRKLEQAEGPSEQQAARRQRLDAERQALPIWAARTKLLEQVRAHPALVVVGETGSGKTTQIPQLLFRAGLARGGMIACTQPRRVAALTVARRVADEMGVKLGQLVGYSIRFDDVTSASTRIKYMTDGMLLREALLDPMLQKYKVVIVDEAHERTVQTDVLIGLLKGVQKRRGPSDFRILIMSATLDADKFVSYFSGAAAAWVRGRQFPVQVMYTSQPEDNYLEAALNATLQAHVDEAPGDILVFLTGKEEIDSLERLLQDRAAQLPPDATPLALQVVPIYAAMPPEQQMKAFEPAPPNTRKAILATNIAETSITISGVRYVIDAGFVKARGYNAKLGADSLQVVPVSQAQARQRSGRAGREAAGKAFRLFTEDSFRLLDATTAPEIQRSNLGSVVLQLKALGIQDVLGFDFMDPPPRAAIVRSLELLYALGGLDPTGALTQPLGAQLARLPVDPMFGKVLLAAAPMGCAVEAMMVVAMVSSDGVFFNPSNKREEAQRVRKKFVAKEGDHHTLLAVLRAFQEVPRKEQAGWASDNFINIRSLRKAQDVYQQLEQHLVGLGLQVSSCGNDPMPLQRALTAGLFPHASRRTPDGAYKVLATGQEVRLHPSSVLLQRKPECIVFNELVTTTKAYARDACAIEPRWLPELAPAFFAAKLSAAAVHKDPAAAAGLGVKGVMQR